MTGAGYSQTFRHEPKLSAVWLTKPSFLRATHSFKGRPHLFGRLNTRRAPFARQALQLRHVLGSVESEGHEAGGRVGQPGAVPSVGLGGFALGLKTEAIEAGRLTPEGVSVELRLNPERESALPAPGFYRAF